MMIVLEYYLTIIIIIVITASEKKVITLTFLRRAKEPDFGAGVLVYLDFLCIDTPIHAKAPGPAPPQIYKPEKQPF